ncbi:hypothetical protein BH18ACI4_BH18ACI4_15000 [soil metagenome]
MLRGPGASAVAVGALGRSKDTFRKAWGPTKHFAYPADFDNVYANGNNHRF